MVISNVRGMQLLPHLSNDDNKSWWYSPMRDRNVESETESVFVTSWRQWPILSCHQIILSSFHNSCLTVVTTPIDPSGSLGTRIWQYLSNVSFSDWPQQKLLSQLGQKRRPRHYLWIIPVSLRSAVIIGNQQNRSVMKYKTQFGERLLWLGN